ncbi:DNA-processing protein DprA [Candidatus Agathobaculum pullicola]|uniref:DNA-processing protein DprA n=1 Tax=Candidatus Agathobaculum pullicola TaxID=2838426 RepID=UPI003F8E1B97
MSSRLSYVWLATRRGLGAGAAVGLLRAFGSPEAVFAADRTSLTTARDCPLRKVQVDALCDKNTDEAERILAQCAGDGIQIITLGDSAYPDRLRAIENPPVVLYVRGKWPDFDVMPGIAVVGTREATPYGLQTAEHIGSALGRAGFITVSGMALGNDGAAHRGALRAGGLTVAVLAGGVDVCYPPQHRGLMGDILLSGAIVSEYPPGTEPRGEHYHARNRIISGLSVAAVIVEAPGYRSGALITARAALDQGRDVYAVPGALDAPQSAACNALIEKGEAALLRSPEALVRTYSGLLPARSGEHRAPHFVKTPQKTHAARQTPRKTEKPAPPPPSVMADSLSGDERRIVELVQQGVGTPEDLIERCGLPAPRVMSLITMLEMDGILRREKGRLVIGCQ